jgi:HPt (histidine-containing phosphotransfer) domain-containing protein
VQLEDANSPVNMKQLKEIMDNDDELVRECLDDFVNDYPEIIVRIQSSVRENNCEELEKTAHSFKGTLKYLAAEKAAEAALQLENMGRNGKITGADGFMSVLESECERIRKFVEDY